MRRFVERSLCLNRGIKTETNLKVKITSKIKIRIRSWNGAKIEIRNLNEIHI